MTIRKHFIENPPVIKANENPMLLNENEVADLTGVSVSYLRKARCEGVLKHKTPPPPFIKLGDRVYYRRDLIIAWVAGLPMQSSI